MPLLAALLWLLVNILSGAAPVSERVVHGANIFFAAFFFCSWLTSQWFRVAKQQKVEGRLEDILEKVEARTSEVLNNLSGGNSFCFVRMFNLLEHGPLFGCIQRGDYPLREVFLWIEDVDGRAMYGPAPLSPEQHASISMRLAVGVLPPGDVRPFEARFPTGFTERRYEIAWIALNGRFSQKLRVKALPGGFWASAVQVSHNGEVIFEEIHPEWPGELPSEMFDWL